MMRILRNMLLMAAAAVVGRRLVKRGGPPGGAGSRLGGEGASGGAKPAASEALEPSWRQRLFTIGGFIAVLAVVGGLILVSGIVPIEASSGHWAITKSLLEFAKRRSVVTHSFGIKSPPLDDPALVLRGAGHYETGCRPCHGAPGLSRSVVALQMTAQPPDLIQRIHRWKPHHLFYIVKHGIKLTGMPAWPSDRRDDEVWSMVAFLQRLPNLSEDDYRRLAIGDAARSPATEASEPRRSADENPPGVAAPTVFDSMAEAEATPRQRALAIPASVAQSCARCHGTDGRGRGTGAFPRLDGQSSTYLFAALRAFARGDRHSGIMRPVAADLSVAEMRDVARYYGSLTVGAELAQSEGDAAAGSSGTAPGASEGDAAAGRNDGGETARGASEGDAAANGNDRAAIVRGADIARRGIPAQGVPSCRDCHGPARRPRNPFYPNLAGQYRNYLVLQLELFRDGRRGGSSYAHLMPLVARRLTPEQMRDVARYYEALAPGEE